MRLRREGNGGCVAEEKAAGTGKAVALGERIWKRRKRSMALAAEASGMGEAVEAAAGAANGDGGGTYNSCFYLFIYFIRLFFKGRVRRGGCSGGGSVGEDGNRGGGA